MKTAALRRHELHAARLLTLALAGRGFDARWLGGDDPPDLLFDIDGVRWGVEVTRLYDYVQNPETKRPVSRPEIGKASERVREKILDRLERRPLRYAHRVVVEWPVDRDLEADLVDDAAAEILRAERRELRGVLRGRRVVSAASEDRGGGLGCVVSMAAGVKNADGRANHRDVQASVDWAMRRLVFRKVQSLAGLGSSYERLALLVLNRNPMARRGHVARSLRALSCPRRNLDAILFLDDQLGRPDLGVLEDRLAFFPARGRPALRA